MNPNITPVIETANALQHLVEALDKLAPAVEPVKRAEYEKCIARVRVAKSSLMFWVEDQR